MNRISMAAVIALTALVACKDGGETGDTGPAPCTNSVTPYPADGETQAYFRTTVEAKLQVADATATLALADAAGTAVAGTSTVTANKVVFAPTASLSPETVYNATLTYECGVVEWSFTTSEVGAAVTGDVAGEVYALDLASGRFVHPEGVGDLIGQFLTTQVLVTVSAQDTTANTIDMLGAIAVDGETPIVQDMCTETIPFPTADFSGNPFWEIDGSGTTTMINVAGYSVGIDDLQLSGAFAPDASYIAGARLAGSLDTYPLATIVDATCIDGSSDYPACLEAVCDLAAVIGGCEACGDGSGNHCLSLDVDNISAEGVGGTLVERTVPDLCADTVGCPDYDRATFCPTSN